MPLAALPEYDTIPGPLWLIVILHLLTLTLHFAAMNFLLGGMVVVLFGKIEDRWNNPTVKRYVRLFPTLMAATVTLAVAPLLFTQLTYGGPIYSASIVSGWFWLLVPIAVMVGYYFLYGSAFSRAGDRRVGIWLSVALLCLLYVSLVQSSVFSMAERPDVQRALYAVDPAGLTFNPHVSDWIWRWLHMVTGAVTVGAFLVGVLGRGDEAVFQAAKRFMLGALILASVSGVLYLLTLGDWLKPFMRSAGIWTMTVGIVLSLGSLHFFFKRRFWGAGAMLFASLFAMVYTRHALRLVVLPEELRPETLYADKVAPQWGVFAIFLVCFLVALFLVYWMLKTWLTDRGEADPMSAR